MPISIFLLGSGQKYDYGKSAANKKLLDQASGVVEPVSPRSAFQQKIQKIISPISAQDVIAKLTPEPKQTINTSFYEACEGEKLILDGPQKMGGAYDPAKIKDNVDKAVAAIIKYLTAQDKLPIEKRDYTVNLTGFSRGSITCIKIANELQRQIDADEIPSDLAKKIKVNILAEDPVSGMSDRSDITTRNIPPIVKNYVATLQCHERRQGFIPQDLSRAIIDPNNTKFTFLPLYGNHSASNKVRKNYECAALNWQIKYDFFRQNGTNFKDAVMPPLVGDEDVVQRIMKEAKLPTASDDNLQGRQKLLELYASAKKNKSKYEKSSYKFQAADAPIPGAEREFMRQKDMYVTDKFFMNQHERELFKLAYPVTFNHLFENGFGSLDQVWDRHMELDRMQAKNPILFDRLLTDKKLVINNNQADFASETHEGVARIERCHFILNSAHPSSTVLANEILLTTNRYQHEKAIADGGGKIASEYFTAHGQRSQYELCETIKKETQAILNSTPDLTENEKKKLILDNLVKHVSDLKSVGSNSKLIAPLVNILGKNGIQVNVSSANLDSNPAMAGIGQGLRTVGQSIQATGRVLFGLVSYAGDALSNLGARLYERSAMTVLIAAPLVAVGKILTIPGKLFEAAGNLFKKMSDSLVKQSNLYKVEVVTTKPQIPTYASRANQAAQAPESPAAEAHQAPASQAHKNPPPPSHPRPPREAFAQELKNLRAERPIVISDISLELSSVKLSDVLTKDPADRRATLTDHLAKAQNPHVEEKSTLSPEQPPEESKAPSMKK
jgi:hypothetical protein